MLKQRNITLLIFEFRPQVVKYWCVGLEHHRPITWRTRDETLQSFSTWEHEKHRFVSYPIQSKSLDTILIEGQLNVMQAAVQGGGLHAQVEVVRVSQVFKKQHLSTCPWLGLGKHCVWVKITALFVYFPSWAYLRYACNLSYLIFWMQPTVDFPCACMTQPSIPDRLPMIFWLHLTSSFATTIITVATRHHSQTTNVNMSRNKPFLQ